MSPAGANFSDIIYAVPSMNRYKNRSLQNTTLTYFMATGYVIETKIQTYAVLGEFEEELIV